jgi:hypothetical protein
MSERFFVLALCLAIPIRALSQEMKCTASDGAGGDQFGYSVGIGGDHAIIGAMYDDDAGTTSGSAYVYYRNEGGLNNWGEVKKLAASDAAASSYFGQRVAVSGDYAIAGAPFAYGSSGTIRRGAAYVFYRNMGGADEWGETKKLNTHTGVSNTFGWSVDIEGDYVIVGDYYDDTIGLNCGSAHLFKRNSGGVDNWGEISTIFPACYIGSHFGKSVAISGDHAIIGAGAHYAQVWRRDQSDPDIWSKVTTLVSGAADNFGHAVAMSGDYAVVGAPGDDDLGTSAGAAHVFYRHEGGADAWGLKTKIVGSDVAESHEFGHSVSIDGDYAVVGTPGDVEQGTASGAAYVFHRNEGGSDNWGELTKIISTDGTSSDEFGHSVAIDGDHVIAGAPNDDDNGSESGSAYLYDWSALLAVELVSLSAVADGDGVVLTWITAAEIDNAGFEVQRRTPGDVIGWRSLDFVQGHGTTTELQTYVLRVAALKPGVHVFRLKQIDFDGASNYTSEVSVNLTPLSYRLHEAYPNPFNPATTISYDLPRSAYAMLTVYDVMGRQLAVLADGEMQAGHHEVSFDATDLPSGIFFYRLEARDYIATKRMAVVR